MQKLARSGSSSQIWVSVSPHVRRCSHARSQIRSKTALRCRGRFKFCEARRETGQDSVLLPLIESIDTWSLSLTKFSSLQRVLLASLPHPVAAYLRTAAPNGRSGRLLPNCLIERLPHLLVLSSLEHCWKFILSRS